jgi:hypothetical protein
VLGLEFDADGDRLRLYDPRTRRWLPTHEEGKLEAEQESRQQKQLRRKAEQALRQAEAEIERLRRLLDSRE